MSTDIHDQQEKQDLDLQHEVAQAILKAEEGGKLAGVEAPVYRCHTFLPTKAGDTYARAITRQLNHLAKALGVHGFQVLYKEDTLKGDGTQPDSGYFQIRVFADVPTQS
jgi:hypothetical protein